ncbi:MAG: formyltetrahydrofolate deformylase [Actinomycetota bacterium]
MKHVVLLLSCQDRPGIVAGVTGWVAKIGGNITDAQQHTDHHDGMFFQRVKFTPPEGVSVPDLESKFRAVANDLKLNCQFCTLPFRPRTAILVSRHLHCLSDVLSRVQLDDVPIDVQFVASNHDDGREISEMFGYRFIHLPIEAGAATRLEQEAHLSRLLDKQSLDLVILARYMMVLPKHIVEPWFGRMINIHHSFLPSFVGANPYRQAHDRGVKVIGATAHYVSEVLDEGPIIAQDVVDVSHRDDVAALTRRGRDLETTVLAAAIRAHVEHRVLMFGNRTIVFD